MSSKSTIYPSKSKSWLSSIFAHENALKNMLIALIMIFIGLVLAYLTSEVDMTYGMMAAIAVVAVFFLILCVLDYVVGYYLLLISSAFMSMPGRMFGTTFPTGLIVELITYMVLVGALTHKNRKQHTSFEVWKTPIAIILLINLAYFLMDAANPVRHSLFGWSLYVRKQISFLMFYYLTWLIIDSYRRVQQAIYIWLGLSLFIAWYGIKQHFVGFFNFETAWLYADPDRPALYFQGGFMRKFSILSDPSIFALVMSAAGLMTLVLGIRHKNRIKSWLLIFAGSSMIFSTFFSGTRTANLIIAAGLASYCIFTLSEFRTLLLTIGAGALIAFILYGPMNNVVVQRIRSTLDGKKDASQMVRENTRHNVQPYIYKHPTGGGIYTCGIEGELYNPGHYLMPFQPDSGYMKIMMEQGWVGLLIHVILLFTIIKTGLDGFYRSKKHHIKTVYIALTVFAMGLCIGQITQIAIWGYPYIFLLYSSFAIFYKLPLYDQPAKYTPEHV